MSVMLAEEEEEVDVETHGMLFASELDFPVDES